jgi:hypothetical protein
MSAPADASAATVAPPAPQRVVIVPGNGCGDIERANWSAVGAQSSDASDAGLHEVATVVSSDAHCVFSCCCVLRYCNVAKELREVWGCDVRVRSMPDPLQAKASIWIPFIVKELGADEVNFNATLRVC